jgi:hypothetical protein
VGPGLVRATSLIENVSKAVLPQRTSPLPQAVWNFYTKKKLSDDSLFSLNLITIITI